MAQYEKGIISTNQFCEEWRSKTIKPISQTDIIKSWNAMLLDLPIHRLHFIEELRKSYQVYLLSNTNELHIAAALRHIKDDLGISNFEDTYFDHVYYSHIIGMRKPDTEIYDFVIQDQKLDKSETLFIDDLAHNVQGAKTSGIHAALHNPKLDIVDELSSYISSVEK